MTNAVISGMGSYVPPKILDNAMLEKMVDTSNEWIIERTGIERRHILEEGQFGSDMAVNAALDALKNAETNAEDVDLILCSTLTADYLTPTNACIVQGAIGATHAAAVDLNAACSGFIYALSMAKAYILSGEYKTILIISVEAMSKVVEWKDRSTCVLFGDAAGAAVVTATQEDYGIIKTSLGANGANGMSLTIPNVKVTEDELAKRPSGNPRTFWMDGSEVFKFAVRTMVASVQEMLGGLGKSTQDIDILVPHQANLRIIDAAKKRLKLPEEQVLCYIQDYGNVSSACIPITICRALKEGRIKDGDNVVLVGFGGGLTWGSALIKWKAIKK